MITYGTSTVYSSFDKGAKARLGLSVPQAILALKNNKIPEYKRFLPLGVSGNDASGVDCLLPDVRYEI